LDAAAQAWLVAEVGRQPDATLAELRAALLAEIGQRVSVGACWTSTGCGVKKGTHACERDTPRVHELRRQHEEAVAARTDAHLFYFLDEMSLRLDYTRRHERRAAQARAGAGHARAKGCAGA
jgi:hypothetical protein